MDKRKSFKGLLIDLSIELGDEVLVEILKRALYQLGKNGIEIPEDSVNLDLSIFSNEELESLVLLSAEELEILNEFGCKKKILEKWKICKKA